MTASEPRHSPSGRSRVSQDGPERSGASEGRSVRYGRATVSWGPRFYGPNTVIANCPLDDFPDLITAIGLARQQIEAC